ncbi:hypothetical protein ACFORO_12365 [Amycolatopsis halotolerans]|uniref:Uncharacterized protein n=1 Tax=Amycolatopsis halotolerans TaxID=330083 RepID=A0ABV7QCA1_9PSEU
MTDADTPRVPDLWWHPEHGYIAQVPEGRLGEGRWHKVDVASGRYITNFGEPRPADAVKLGDVEALRRELSEMTDFAGQQSNARRESDRRLDKLRADLRAVLDSYDLEGFIDRGIGAPDAVDRIRARLDREPGREEPTEATSAQAVRAELDAVGEALWAAVGSDPGYMRGYTLVDLVGVLKARADSWQEQVREPSAEPAPREGEVFERLPDEGSLPQYRLRKPGREELCKPCGESGNCQRPEAADCIQKPVLHGFTVPPHIRLTARPGGVDVACLHLDHAGGFPGYIIRDGEDERFAEVLRDHAHGHAVEHQPTDVEWHCARCGSDRWVGWRAGPEHEGYPRKAQCVPCGHVQDLPPVSVVEPQPDTEEQP